jgi:3-oxoacyl-[acyl-carrier protein] reductase
VTDQAPSASSPIKAAGGNALAAQANETVVAEVERLFADAVASFGPLDILVNNASVFAFAMLEQTTDEQLHKMLDTNLWGTIVTCREALKHFGNDGGSIINIGSMSSERFSAGAVAYTASKAGITGVTGVLAMELASRASGSIKSTPVPWTLRGHGPSVP